LQGAVPFLAASEPSAASGTGLLAIMAITASVTTLVLAGICLLLWRRLHQRVESSAPPAPPAAPAPRARRSEPSDRTTEVLIRHGLPAARLGSWERDLASGRMHWSEHVHQLFGLQVSEMPTTYEGVLALLHPDDRRKMEMASHQLQRSGVPEGLELRVMWPDGSVHWHATRAELARDASGNPVRVVGIAMDITERKRIEDELRQSQRLLHRGFEAAGVGVWEWDAPSGKMVWSGTVERIFGMPPGAIIGTFDAFLAMVHPDDLPTVKAMVAKAMAEGGGYQVEHRIRSAPGTVRWIAVQGDVLRDAAGRSIGMAGVAMVVTQRRQAEEELRISEQRYRTVISTMHEGVVIYAPDGRIHDCNRSAEEMLGLTRRQLVGLDPLDPGWRMVHEDGRSFLTDEYPTAVVQRTHRSQHGVVVGIDIPDHGLRWLSVNADPMPSTDAATAIGVVATFSDITASRNAERALRESEKRWRSLAENVPDTIAMVDRTGSILFINRLPDGLTRDDVLGAHVSRFMPPTFITLLDGAVERIFDHGEAVSADVQTPGPDQETRWHSCHISPVRLQGRTIAATIRASDITERRQAEDQRRRFQIERERLLEQLEEQRERMPIGCILWDREHRISYANPAAERIFGHADDGMLGHGPELLVRSEDLSQIAVFHQRLERGDMGIVSTNRTRDGRTISCEWHPTPLFDTDGVRTGVMTMVMDIGERAALEEQLRQSQKMEAVGQLAGGIAHDFNNLLTAIMGYGDLLDNRLPANDVLMGYVQQIKKAAKRAAALTYQLLAFSRKQVLQSQLLVLGEVIRELEPMLRRLIGEHITLETDLAAGSWQVLADPSQMEQVVMNLVVNARDAMPLGGILTIGTSNRTLDAEAARGYAEVPPGDYVQLRVSDTGRGMDDQLRERIFEPFFTTKPDGKGTGLGLSVVFGVVRQSGGFIFVDSAPDQGARFDILLPRADSTPDPFKQRDSTAQLAVRGSETILLVEDDDGVRLLARDTLEASGYTVLAVGMGAEAVEISSHYPKDIDLLLTDVVMPGMGGREVADRIQGQRPGIKVLFMSGYTDDVVLTHGVSNGTAAFIEKPFAAPKLLGRIRKVLAGQL
jgi:PAS domain S-box-containing protein